MLQDGSSTHFKWGIAQRESVACATGRVAALQLRSAIRQMVQALVDTPTAGKHGTVEPAYSGLLQELCLALVGITGDVFVDTHVVDKTDAVRSPSSCTFRVNPEATWLCVSDRSQMEDVLLSGYHFYEISRLVQRHQATWGPQAAKGCWQGLCLGLEGGFRSSTCSTCPSVILSHA